MPCQGCATMCAHGCAVMCQVLVRLQLCWSDGLSVPDVHRLRSRHVASHERLRLLRKRDRRLDPLAPRRLLIGEPSGPRFCGYKSAQEREGSPIPL